MTTNFTPAQADIYAAYLDLSVKDQDWIRLVKLRAHHMLSGWDRADIDAAIMALVMASDAHLAPDSNRKVLTQADHDAAIYDGDICHLIAFPID